MKAITYLVQIFSPPFWVRDHHLMHLALGQPLLQSTAIATFIFTLKKTETRKDKLWKKSNCV